MIIVKNSYLNRGGHGVGVASGGEGVEVRIRDMGRIRDRESVSVSMSPYIYNSLFFFPFLFPFSFFPFFSLCYFPLLSSVLMPDAFPGRPGRPGKYALVRGLLIQRLSEPTKSLVSCDVEIRKMRNRQTDAATH